MKEMINKSIQDTFTSTDPRIVELRRQMFCQAGVLPQEGPSAVQGQMVPGTRQLPRYPVDDITEPTFCTLQMPFGRARKKKEVAQGVVQPPESGATYNGKPIPPDCALVDVVWVNPDFEHEELDFPTEREIL
jgi:hypothetical protein